MNSIAANGLSALIDHSDSSFAISSGKPSSQFSPSLPHIALTFATNDAGRESIKEVLIELTSLPLLLDSYQMKSLRDAIRPTTLIESAKLRDQLGIDITIASETFQHTGSFKFRAAYNVVLNSPNVEFIGVSSGNFGQSARLRLQTASPQVHRHHAGQFGAG